MKKFLDMVLMLGLSVVFLAGCGSGKAIDNCIPLAKLDFAKVPQIYKEMEAKLKDIDGTKIKYYFNFNFWNG